MDAATLKKERARSLTKARARFNTTDRSRIEITPDEWAAIQAGAISNHTLTEILRYTDDSKIKEYAMPRTKRGMPASKIALAQAMAKRGYLQEEIASRLGVSTTTLAKALSE